MAPLRFRAWRNPTPLDPNDVEEWEQPKMYYDVQKLYDGGIEGLGHVSSFGSILNDEEYNVMQSTGLHDKNGKEIFEGDICEYPLTEDRGIGEVVYFGAMFAIDGLGLNMMHKGTVEVLGNIYEDSHLLPQA